MSGAVALVEWRGSAASGRAIKPWCLDKVREVMNDRSARSERAAAADGVQILIGLAVHDGIRREDAGEVTAIAARFTRSSRVEAALLPRGERLYEIHKRGHESVEAQLDFTSQMYQLSSLGRGAPSRSTARRAFASS
jgi:hypothetical protein